MTKGIVIGAGKSYGETDILEQIIDSKFKGQIFVSDRILCESIRRGLDPTYFNIVTGSQEYVNEKQIDLIKSYYNCIKFPNYITAYLSDTLHYDIVHHVKYKACVIHFFHRRYKHSRITIPDGSPVINTCGNVGMMGWNVLRQLRGCDQIALLGMDFDSDHLKNEMELSLKEIKRYAFECSTFNLSQTSRLKSDKILECSLHEFLTDNYEINNKKDLRIVDF